MNKFKVGDVVRKVSDNPRATKWQGQVGVLTNRDAVAIGYWEILYFNASMRSTFNRSGVWSIHEDNLELVPDD